MDETTREAIRQDIANSRDELEAARILQREGKYRQALSRAYYAVFYAATAVLGLKRIKRAKHSGVQSAFGQFFVKTKLIELEYNAIYVRVRESRELSDYERGFVPMADFANDKIEDAEKFVARMEKYLREVGARIEE
ncbi:MAG: HEPN domain-containing protein [Chloroflexi bacterium]|nr:HEPN domain-containing protein [Chloroflexota bacterium]